MFLGVLISWIVLVGCIYAAYLGVREVEQALARRPFSILLTLLLVLLSAGLLEFAIDYLSGQWLSQSFGPGGYYDNRWESLIAIALTAGSGVVIGRDVLERNRQAICPQCGTPLRGRAVCTSCAWGSLRPPASLAGMVARAGAMRPAPGVPRQESAPTVAALGTLPPDAANASAFCTQCGAGLAAGQTFCTHCGAPAPAATA